MAPRVIVVTVIAAAAIFSATLTAATCPDECSCTAVRLNCSYSSYQQPPDGSWANITTLWFAGNNITAIGEGFFSQLPELQLVYLDKNLLSVLDFEPFYGPNLTYIRIQQNVIEKILPLADGMELSALSELDLQKNKLESIDPDVFLAFPLLMTLYLSDNPLVIPHDRPLLSHKSLYYLSLARTNAIGGLSAETFKDTPGLGELSLWNSSLTSPGGAFKHLNNLKYLHLHDNQLTSVEVEDLPTDAHLVWLNVGFNPLQRCNTEVLEGVFTSSSYLDISETPLACSCGFEDLYQWAKNNAIHFTAMCGNKFYFCDFDKWEK